MSNSNFIAVLTCPECAQPLETDEQPHIDWKRGQTRLNIQPTQDACEHLFSCLGFITQNLDGPDAQGGGGTPADPAGQQPEASATVDAKAEPAKTEENAPKAKTAAKSSTSKTTSSK